MSEWTDKYLCEPPEYEEGLEEAVRGWERYYERCESYDRCVCTGPIGRDGILPMTGRELGLIGSNAMKVRREMMLECPGIPDEVWERAKHIALNRRYRR